MKVAVIGATGLVGTRMLEVLSQRNFPAREVLVAASREWAPRFAAAGCRVVGNSSCWRMDPTKKLVVPEINGDVLTAEDFIIANPNCSTIQMLLPLAPLHKAFGIKRIVVSTYQSVTGTEYKALSQLDAERKGLEWGAYPAVYLCPIDLNVIPQIGAFGEDGNSEEETKMINETHKILDPSIAVSVTTVRVPVRGGHSEAVNIELEKPFELARVREILSATSGVTLLPEGHYPVPKDCEGKDDVFVGRLRRDTSLPSALNLWCVSDNLRKGAATNGTNCRITVKILSKMKRLNITMMLLVLCSFLAGAQDTLLPSYDWAGFERFEADNKAIAGTSPLAVIMGDSITDGWAEQDPAFFTQNNIVGRGISGQVTSQMLVRFRRDVLDLRPRYVVIIAGINDIARNQGYISQENSIGNILSMCELAVANGIEPVLSTLIPASKVVWRPAITNTRELVAAFNAELRAHAAERGFKLIDLEQLLADENGNTRPDLSEDTIHPTLAGYKIFEEAVLKALQ